jgi:hypothetical protein
MEEDFTTEAGRRARPGEDGEDRLGADNTTEFASFCLGKPPQESGEQVNVAASKSTSHALAKQARLLNRSNFLNRGNGRIGPMHGACQIDSWTAAANSSQDRREWIIAWPLTNG